MNICRFRKALATDLLPGTPAVCEGMTSTPPWGQPMVACDHFPTQFLTYEDLGPREVEMIPAQLTYVAGA